MHYDAIVIGAGPAGSTAAYELATAGLRTLVVEKAKLPRHKTCGGGLTHKVIKILPFDVAPVVERTITSVDFTYQTRHSIVRRSEQPLVHMIRRDAFDHFLVQQAAQAGAEINDALAVTAIRASDGSARIGVSTPRGEFTSDFLIGADGATGFATRALNLNGGRTLVPAVESEVEVDPATADYWRDKLGLDLGYLPGSYGWVFPKDDHLNIGVGGLSSGPNFGTQLKAYDQAHLRARAPQTARVRKNFGYVLPLRKSGAPIQLGNALLVGDAAGLVEAFTGEGIYWAIRSAQIAARAIRTGAAAGYTQQIDAQLMPELLSARRWMSLYVWFPRLCYALPKRWPAMWRAVCTILRGDRSFSDIRKRLGPAGFVETLLPMTAP